MWNTRDLLFFISIAFPSVLIAYFQESFDVCHLIECWRRPLWPKRWFYRQCLQHFTLTFHVNFSASIFTTSTVGSSRLSTNTNVCPRSKSTIGSNLKQLDPFIFLDAFLCDTNWISKFSSPLKRFNLVMAAVLGVCYAFLVRSSVTLFAFPGWYWIHKS